MCRQMEQCALHLSLPHSSGPPTDLRIPLARRVRARAASSEGAKATAPGLPRGKPISVDMLFSAASPTPAAATLPAQQSNPPPPTTTAGMNPLDALFASATMSPRPAAAAAPSPAVANSQTQRLPATLEQLFAAASPTPQAARLPTQQQAQSPPSVASPGAGGGGGRGGGMALLDSIFAAAAEVRSPP